jgi:hypothetical protein
LRAAGERGSLCLACPLDDSAVLRPCAWFAAVTLSLAAFYAIHVWFFLQRRLVDRELLVSFLGLASLFLAITMPVALSSEWVTAAWAVQGLVLVWTSSRLDSRIVRTLGLVLLAIVCLRFFTIDIHREFVLRSGFSAEVDESIQAYLLRLAERALLFGIPIGCLGLTAKLLKQFSAAEQTSDADPAAWSAKNDYPVPLAGSRPVVALLSLASSPSLLISLLRFTRWRVIFIHWDKTQHSRCSGWRVACSCCLHG